MYIGNESFQPVISSSSHLELVSTKDKENAKNFVPYAKSTNNVKATFEKYMKNAAAQASHKVNSSSNNFPDSTVTSEPAVSSYHQATIDKYNQLRREFNDARKDSPAAKRLKKDSSLMDNANKNDIPSTSSIVSSFPDLFNFKLYSENNTTNQKNNRAPKNRPPQNLQQTFPSRKALETKILENKPDFSAQVNAWRDFYNSVHKGQNAENDKLVGFRPEDTNPHNSKISVTTPCPLCGKKCKSAEGLKMHMKAKHGITKRNAVIEREMKKLISGVDLVTHDIGKAQSLAETTHPFGWTPPQQCLEIEESGYRPEQSGVSKSTSSSSFVNDSYDSYDSKDSVDDYVMDLLQMPQNATVIPATIPNSSSPEVAQEKCEDENQNENNGRMDQYVMDLLQMSDDVMPSALHSEDVEQKDDDTVDQYVLDLLQIPQDSAGTNSSNSTNLTNVQSGGNSSEIDGECNSDEEVEAIVNLVDEINNYIDQEFLRTNFSRDSKNRNEAVANCEELENNVMY